MNSIPYNKYIIVMPNGNIRGTNDLGVAKAYINRYYEEKISLYARKDDYADFTEMVDQVRNNICEHIGVDENVCEVYDTESFIDSLKRNSVFEDEVEEVISMLMEKEIKFNVHDYALDSILQDSKKIDVMELYGEL